MTQIPELRGAILGKGYRLGQAVGHAQNALFEATHERIPGRFLVKVFAPEALTKPEAAVRIQRATRVASLLRDPHTFQILDFAVSGETPAFVVMERLDGEFLSVALAHTGALALTRVVDVVDSIGNALAAAHRMGLVHGDLRPDLVVLTNSGTPTAQVAGFGWSKEFRLAATMPDTIRYLAPEQRIGSTVAIDERADQFSLAVIAYEMLSARLPFPDGAGVLSVGPEERHVPPRLAGVVEGIPLAIDDVLQRALSFLPGERFSGIRELVSQLRIASVGLPEPLRAVAEAPKDDDDDDRNVFATTGATLPKRESPFDYPTPNPAVEATGAEERVGDTDVSDWNEAAIATHRQEAVGESASLDADAALVHGESAETTEQSASSEDGKTQITRSPFFEGGDDSSDDDQVDAMSVDADDEEIEADDDADDEDLLVASLSSRLENARLSGPPKGLQLPRTSPPMGLPAPKGVDIAASVARPPVAVAPKGRFAGLTQDPKVRFGAVAVVMVGLATMALLSRGGAAGSKTSATESASTAPAVGATPAVVAPMAATPPVVPAPSVPVVEAVPPKVPVLAIQEPAPPSAVAPSSDSSSGAAATDQADQAEPAAHVASRPRALRPPPVRRAVDKSAAAASPASETSKSEGGAGDCQMRIESHPSAEIWLDGKNTGKHTPLSGYKVSCGTHQLTLKRPEQDIEQMEVLKIKRGQPFRGSYELE